MPPTPHALPLLNFNSRPSARGDGKQPKKYSAEALFQFTPLREGRRAGKSQTACGLHFNSRPSARGDQVHAGTKHEKTISIHAPPRGATRVFAVRAMVDAISIHAPPRGATSHCHYNTGKKGNFNSRPSARGDAGGSGWPPAGSAISIHAPPRGATDRAAADMPDKLHFNSRPSARGDRPPPEQ